MAVDGAVRLGLDVGGAMTAAVVCRSEASWRPAAESGAVEWPSGVYVASATRLVSGWEGRRRAVADPARYVADPWRHVADEQVTVGDVVIGGIDLAAAVLRDAAASWTPSGGGAVLVVPAGWGPRRRTAVRRAARAAGLGQVSLMEAPVAVVRYATGRGDGSATAFALVVDLAGAGEASVVGVTDAGGYEVLATVDCPAVPAQVDAELADVLVARAARAAAEPAPTLTDGDHAAAVDAVRAVLRQWFGSPTVVALPAGLPAVLMTPADVDAVVGPAIDTTVAAAKNAVQAADLPAATVPAVLVVAPAALAAGLIQPVRAAVGDEARVVEPAGLVRALGAANGDSAPVTAVDPLPPVWQAVAVLVPGAAALALLVHALASATVETFSGGAGLNYFIVNWGELATAATLAVLACLSTAVVVGAAVPVPAAVQAIARGQRLSAGLLAAAAGGLAFGFGFAVLGSVTLGLPGGPFVRWALLAPAPLVVAAVAVAAVLWLGRGPAVAWLVDRPQRLMVPVASGAVVAVGLIVAQVSFSLAGDSFAAAASGRLGGLLVGIGAALLLAERRTSQLVLMVLLGLFVAAIVDVSTTGVVGMVYPLAAATWWLRRLWRPSWLTGTGAP
jgi:hypothetical protein